MRGESGVKFVWEAFVYYISYTFVSCQLAGPKAHISWVGWAYFRFLILQTVGAGGGGGSFRGFSVSYKRIDVVQK